MPTKQSWGISVHMTPKQLLKRSKTRRVQPNYDTTTGRSHGYKSDEI